MGSLRDDLILNRIFDQPVSVSRALYFWLYGNQRFGGVTSSYISFHVTRFVHA